MLLHYNELWESRSHSENPGVSLGIQIWKVGHSSIYIYSLPFFQIIREYLSFKCRYFNRYQIFKRYWKGQRAWKAEVNVREVELTIRLHGAPVRLAQPHCNKDWELVGKTTTLHLCIAFASFSGQHYPPENCLVLSPLSGSHTSSYQQGKAPRYLCEWAH